MKQRSDQKALDTAADQQHKDVLLSNIDIRETILQAFEALFQYMEGHVGKAEITNHLKEIGTPDALQVVAAVDDMHRTIRDQHAPIDFSELTGIMGKVFDEVAKLPKDHADIKIPTEMSVSNMTDYSGEFTALLDAVKAIKLVAEAPQVHIPAPNVQVDAPDFTPIENATKAVETAIKAIVIPEYKTDNKAVEKLLKTNNELLQQVVDKPISRSGGGGGRATPYQDANAIPQFVTLNTDGTLPVKPTGTLVSEKFNYIAASYPDTVTEVYSYKNGGATGTLVATVTVVYSDSTKAQIVSVAKT